jgi:hypothetical protein
MFRMVSEECPLKLIFVESAPWDVGWDGRVSSKAENALF